MNVGDRSSHAIADSPAATQDAVLLTHAPEQKVIAASKVVA